MNIKIAQRLKPFSHEAGIYLMLPGTTLRFQVFPTCIFVTDLGTSQLNEVGHLSLSIKGPVQNFTVQADLEHNDIRVLGESAEGYFNYRMALSDSQTGFIFCLERGIPINISWEPVQHEKQTVSLKCKQSACLLTGFTFLTSLSKKIERLSLGLDKKQDWSLVQRRQDLAEIFPFWFALGQLLPEVKAEFLQGTASLLNDCQKAIDDSNYLTVLEPFKLLFKIGFEGILSPRLEDFDYQGIPYIPLPSSNSLSPLILLSLGAKLIRGMFIKESENCIRVLPALSREFHAGRFLNVCCDQIGKIDVEWSKHQIRRMVIRAEKESNLLLLFPKVINRYRLQVGGDRGQIFSNGSRIALKSGTSYFLDRFEH